MLVVTEAQRRELDERGFTVMENFFKGEELAALVDAVGRVDADRAASRKTSTVPRIFLELADHPRILPYVVDLLGWNVHIRDCLFGPVNPDGNRAADRLASAFHFDQEEELNGITSDGVLPLIDLKFSYYLSDHAEPGHACTLLVPGSHRWTPEQRSTWEAWLRPDDVVPLRVRKYEIGSCQATLARTLSPCLLPFVCSRARYDQPRSARSVACGSAYAAPLQPLAAF